MIQHSQPQRRKRGVIVSPRGWQRLQAAEQRTAEQENSGKAYTLEQLGDITGLSPNTITKVKRRQQAVDRQTLESYFTALKLELTPEDYISLDSDTNLSIRYPTPLRGQVPLDSPFYIERPPTELLTYEEVLQPGALVRIKAPKQLGKTSLMARALAAAREKGLREAVVNLQLADTQVLTDLNRFLRWFCAVTTRSLHLTPQIDAYWDEVFGSSYNCTNYFEQYLLPEVNGPIVLALDEVDIVFNYPEIATDFFGMLRAWYEKARYGNNGSELWQQLRLVVVHSTELAAYPPLNLNQSPFNVGLSIELSNFSLEQAQELVQRYGIEDYKTHAAELMELVGGIPCLMQLALHYISSREVSLQQVIEDSLKVDGIFGSHLREQLSRVQSFPLLLNAVRRISLGDLDKSLDPIEAFKLQSIGLIHLSSVQTTLSCKLYQQFFAQVFQYL
ncbi:MAG TPA: AAA-like domain-containing protein [Trichocoleus sp.]|jgi:transcriptional regulator with XRE-family HTH domain